MSEEDSVDRVCRYGTEVLGKWERHGPKTRDLYLLFGHLFRSRNGGRVKVTRSFTSPEDLVIAIPGEVESNLVVPILPSLPLSGQGRLRQQAVRQIRDAERMLKDTNPIPRTDDSTRVPPLLIGEVFGRRLRESNDAVLSGLMGTKRGLHTFLNQAERRRDARKSSQPRLAGTGTAWMLPADFPAAGDCIQKPGIDRILYWDPYTIPPAGAKAARLAAGCRRALIGNASDDEDVAAVLKRPKFLRYFTDFLVGKLVRRNETDAAAWLKRERARSFNLGALKNVPGLRAGDDRNVLARQAYSLLLWNAYLAMTRAYAAVFSLLAYDVDRTVTGLTSDEQIRFRTDHFPHRLLGGLPVAFLGRTHLRWVTEAWERFSSAPVEERGVGVVLVAELLGQFAEVVRERRTADLRKHSVSAGSHGPHGQRPRFEELQDHHQRASGNRGRRVVRKCSGSDTRN